MAWVEKDLKYHLVLIPLPWARLPRATSSLALNASSDGASTASLGNQQEIKPQRELPKVKRKG